SDLQLCISFFVLHSSISPFRKIYHKKNILLSKRLFTPPLNERDHLASNPSGESAHPKQPVTPPERFQISLIYFTAAGNGPVTFIRVIIGHNSNDPRFRHCFLPNAVVTADHIGSVQHFEHPVQHIFPGWPVIQ